MIEKNNLIRILMVKKGISASKLSEIFGVNINSIYKAIETVNFELEKNGAEVISKKPLGFSLKILDEALFGQYINQEFYARKQDYTVAQILSAICFSKEYIKLDDICNHLYLSRSSIRTSMKDVRSILGKYDLLLRSKPGRGLTLVGDEADIRKCIYENLGIIDYIGPQEYNNAFNHINKIFSNILEKYNLEIMILTQKQIIDHLVIMLGRWKIGKFFGIRKSQVGYISLESKEYRVSFDTINIIAKDYCLSVPKDEAIFLSLFLIGDKVYKFEDVNNKLAEDVNTMINDIFNQLDATYKTNFSQDNDLRVSIILHIVPLLTRLKYRISRKNPLSSHIKSHYLLPYDMAVSFSVELNNRLDFILNDDEIGYIALHFGLALQKQEMRDNKRYRLKVICKYGHTMASLIALNITRKFNDRIKTIETNYLQDARNCSEYDLYITVGDNRSYNQKENNVEITTKLTNEDYRMVELALHNLEHNIRLVDLIHKDLFFNNIVAENKKEALEKMVKLIPKKYSVPNWLLPSLLEREALAPTDVGNSVAIPHSIRNDFETSFVCVAILDKTILWDNKKVSLILLFCLNPSHNGELFKLYDDLVKLIESPDAVTSILNHQSYLFFENVLRSLNDESRSQDKM